MMPSEGFVQRDYTSAEELWAELGPTNKLFPNPAKAIFRGQADAGWGLVPSVLRDEFRRQFVLIAPGRDTADFQVFFETCLLETFGEFCDRAGVRLPGDSILFRKRVLTTQNQDQFLRSPETWPNPELLEVMALAQHHGVPTRLLDWSVHPYAAVYFAASSALRRYENWKRGELLAIWALNIETIAMFDGCIQIVRPPGSVTPHLAAQSGLFTVQTQKVRRGGPLSATSLEDEFKGLPNSPLLKLTLPVTETPKLHDWCKNIGVSAATMFPGSDGAARAVVDSMYLWNANYWLREHGL